MNAKAKKTSTGTEAAQLQSLLSLFTNHFHFTSIYEVVFGSALLYTFRLFERTMGSSKYSIFILSSLIMTTMLQLAYIVIFRRGSAGSPGPYGLIFAGLVLFFKEIPSTRWFKLFGFPFNDKIFAYLTAASLLIGSNSNIAQSVMGIVAGTLYHIDVFNLKKRRMPAGLVNLCNKWILPLLQSPNKPTSMRPLIENQSRVQQQQQRMQNILQPMFNAPPSEENIQMLEAMGFDRQQAIIALQRTQNDLNAATNFLLSAN
ncbi:hypothetical protein SAMD00019534_071310 [Acytostelium subglobosum LB1]|uniref:hypothetical protein n=1 Tax=Acytostelium subglobosum LB1 TaxID=1410327 RepID=UPI000644BBC1|nr:hypothetical protein SAMD00019534_071310 [Acytostelium subglobosum LB1]GAM23956.1 hypothetical protein SAMD00019534_071310 [Acytostelium subglobosum LB1]|eukprot:XP_012752992.1 hypothetical protein SAMD00019534_071310 [Acytostelium subglobosum LB1]